MPTPKPSLLRNITTLSSRTMSTTRRPFPNPTRVAVLYQAAPPPAIDGIRKPMKPGGYQDSGADIAYTLSKAHGIDVVIPHPHPDPSDQTQWSFPDTEPGILAALDAGATHLWANTILFKSHPLQTSPKLLSTRSNEVKIIGQPPCLVELYDDKRYVNDWLRSTGRFSMPRGWTLRRTDSSNAAAQITALNLAFPIVAKPCRGRGSAGVRLCRTAAELAQHVGSLYQDSSVVMLEEFLQGEEATVTVMPPSSSTTDYWALPVVTRFNHEDGIAPYNGNVAVTLNSRAVSAEDFAADGAYAEVARQCEGVARLLRVTAPIRIDVRRRGDERGSEFVLFDVNMKPNMTGPGRPGREEQASLTALAAAQLGWDYSRLLLEMLSTAVPLQRLLELKPEEEH